MKKHYMAPDLVIDNLMLEEKIMQTSGEDSPLMLKSSTPASGTYEGGGDAKRRIVDFSDEDFQF